jgi:dolichol-phosphate mannosyltransferase
VNTEKEQNFISLVAYIYNNEDEIQAFYQTINGLLKKHFLNYEIIFVNNASNDQSVKRLKDVLKKENGSLSVITMSYFQGLEKAMRAGVDLAIGDFVYEFDTIAINYHPELIMDMYFESLKNKDIVIAAEKNSEKWLSKQFYRVFNKYANMQYKLGTERFRLLSRRAINRVNNMSEHLPYRKASYATAGLNLKRIEYEKTKDIFIPSMENEKTKLAMNNLILFTDFFYKWSVRIAIIMMFITLFVVGYTVFMFITRETIEGWATTMLFLSFGFMGLFIFLTMIIKYMDLLVRLTFTKQKYLIQGIEKIY